MFDKLEDLIHHYEELMNLLSEPDVANDANRFKKLMKEYGGGSFEKLLSSIMTIGAWIV